MNSIAGQILRGRNRRWETSGNVQGNIKYPLVSFEYFDTKLSIMSLENDHISNIDNKVQTYVRVRPWIVIEFQT